MSNIQKIKNYSGISAALKKRAGKLTWGKIKVDKVRDSDLSNKRFEFYATPRVYRGTYGFYCLWSLNDEGFLALACIYRGKKKWYDVLKKLIPSKRRELKYETCAGRSMPNFSMAQKKCQAYNALSKEMQADLNPQSKTVSLCFYRYIADKQELNDAVSTALACLQDEETKNFVASLGV